MGTKDQREMTDDNQCREAFEAWAKEKGYLWSHNLNYENGKYRPPTVNTTFKAWQAACEWKEKSK